MKNVFSGGFGGFMKGLNGLMPQEDPSDSKPAGAQAGAGYYDAQAGTGQASGYYGAQPATNSGIYTEAPAQQDVPLEKSKLEQLEEQEHELYAEIGKTAVESQGPDAFGELSEQLKQVQEDIRQEQERIREEELAKQREEEARLEAERLQMEEQAKREAELAKQHEEEAKRQASGRKCPQCGTPAGDGINFCPVCGTKIPEVVAKRFCTQCGAENVSDARFCGQCGSKLEA